MNLAAAGLPPPARGAAGGALTRRRLIGALAASAAAAAMPGRAHADAPPRRVAVIGGGLAGLVALARLKRRGADATLYEARQAVGGRTRSVEGVFAPGFAFDEGGQLVNSDHVGMVALVRALGLRLINREALGVPSELHLGRDGRIAPEAELAEALRGVAAQIARDAARLDADYDAVAPDIDALSVAAYLDRAGLGPGDARDAIEAGIRTEYGAEPEEATALELLFNLPSVDGQAVARLPQSDERYLVEGGAGRIVQTMLGPLRGSVRLGTRLTVVRLSAAGVALGFTDGREVSADRVILALPAALLREIRFEGPLPPLWRACIAEVGLGRNEKLLIGYPGQPWIGRLGLGGALWAAAPGFSEAWDARSGVPSPGAGALGFLTGGAQVEAAEALTAVELARRFDAAARAAIPALPPPGGAVRRTRWSTDPLSRGSYVNFRPGQLTRFGSLLTLEEAGRPPVASRAGPILFAGEWCSDAWPGYMEGAVQTGRIAADAALR